MTRESWWGKWTSPRFKNYNMHPTIDFSRTRSFCNKPYSDLVCTTWGRLLTVKMYAYKHIFILFAGFYSKVFDSHQDHPSLCPMVSHPIQRAHAISWRNMCFRMPNRLQTDWQPPNILIWLWNITRLMKMKNRHETPAWLHKPLS